MAERPVKTRYSSKHVAIPDSYLVDAPPDAAPITYTPIDFSQTSLPEYSACYAAVLDNVLSPSECAQLLELAEASVDEADYGGDGTDPWQPARVNVGGGFEVLMPDYRLSDRIIWDSQDIVDRLWARMATVPDLLGRLRAFSEHDLGGGGLKRNDKPGMDWKFGRLNKRLRFLRYGNGHFFRPHCDGQYGEQGPDGEVLRTWFTVHLYLNDSKAEVDTADLEGGATSFLSSDEKRRLDVDPKAGRVLVFQHRRLYHSGDDVVAGTKFTVRTDILYELQ